MALRPGKRRLRGAAEATERRRELLEAQREIIIGYDNCGSSEDGVLRSIRATVLSQIDAALARMEDGTYGTCGRCGKPIAKARLAALPQASLCLNCKRQNEHEVGTASARAGGAVV